MRKNDTHRHHLLFCLSSLLMIISSSSSSPIKFPITFSDDPKATLPLLLVNLGSPSNTLRLYPDTGSDISWAFCDAFHSTPTFSYTYDPDSDDSEEAEPDILQFTAEYEDGSSASGDWASVSIFTHETVIEDVAFGCADRTLSNFTGADGVFALSRNSPMTFGHDVFSYVLQDGDHLVFGDDGGDHGELQYVKLAESNYNSSLYTAEVLGLFMGDVKLDVRRDIWKYNELTEDGGIVFDTGSTMTYLPEPAFHAIVEYLMETYGELVHLKMDGEVCFEPYVGSFESKPRLRIKFEGGGEFGPKVEHLYYRDWKGRVCLNVWPIGDRGAIIGSMLMRGFYWEYDLLNNVVGFAPLDE